MVLAIHGTKHYWTRLTWVCDIAQCLRKHSTIDWKLLMSQSVKHDARGMLMVAMLLAREVLEVPIPTRILAEARPVHHVAAKDLAERLFRRAISQKQWPLGSRMQLTGGGLFESLMFHVRTRDRWTTAIRYCFHRVVTPNAVDRGHTKVPRLLRFTHYAVRPLRLLAVYGPWARRRPSQMAAAQGGPEPG